MVGFRGCLLIILHLSPFSLSFDLSKHICQYYKNFVVQGKMLSIDNLLKKSIEMTINLQQITNQIEVMTDSFIGYRYQSRPNGRQPFGALPSQSILDGRKVFRNFFITAPPESQEDLKIRYPVVNSTKNLEMTQKQPFICPSPQIKKQDIHYSSLDQSIESKDDEDARVKGKLNKKGKRDGQNIRTYARYDSVIQALEEELLVHKIIPKEDDKKLLERFEMKSKRSLERFFFYLLLAKRQNKLGDLLPKLKLKIRAKIQQKGGHRTQEFLTTLQNCIQKYIQAAQSLEVARSLQEAKKAFSIAYLNESGQNGNIKRPHHNKVKGIQKCLQIYKIIMNDMQDVKIKDVIKQEQQEKQNKITSEGPVKKDQIQKPSQCSPQKLIQPQKTHKRAGSKNQDESYSVPSEQLLDNPNQKRKKIGIKNKKQDERDIQKYAKFDIVSESSLEFLKKQKLHKNIPQICKKLSQRSLHFFFVILALIQKQRKDQQFLAHLQTNYQKKVAKRYTQRSQYFRQRLYFSFQNLIEATRKLFQGNLQQALDIAYEVKADKKPHPAKASQQKKCREIYEATRESLQGTGNEYQSRLESLIHTEKTHRSRLIKCIKPMKPHNREMLKKQIITIIPQTDQNFAKLKWEQFSNLFPSGVKVLDIIEYEFKDENAYSCNPKAANQTRTQTNGQEMNDEQFMRQEEK